MKKMLSIVALVAMITVASVAQAQDNDPVVVTGEVNATQTVTGCSATISGITPLTKPSSTCQSTYTSNDATGYRLSFDSSSSDLVSALPDTIAGLNEGAPADATIDTCTIGEDCFSWYLNANSDATATVVDDSTNDQGVFSGGEHAVETSAEEFLNHATTQVLDATVTQTFYATVDDTTQSALDYTNNAVVYIATY